jgi:Cof subfamily protein (haloacid dehalogenase superfamily)
VTRRDPASEALPDTAAGPPSPRLLACDLDGTLLQPDGTVSDRTRIALRGAERQGIEIVLVTGRPPRFVARSAAETGVDGPAICSNGAVVFDWSDDRILHAETISTQVVAEAVAALRAEVRNVALGMEWGTSFSFEARFAQVLGRDDLPVVDDIAGVNATAHKLLAVVPDGRNDALFEAAHRVVGDLLTVTHSGLPFVEMGPPGVTKATGLARWAAERDIPSSAVVAFGDMPNDVPMLTWAGWGVAVANGHPAALAVADEVTGANVEDGVAQVIERMLGGRVRGSTSPVA